MNLLSLLLEGVKREAPRYYRSVREVERLPAGQRMSVDSLPGLLAARGVPAAEREMFDLVHPLYGAPTEPVPRDELADYLRRTLSAAASEIPNEVHGGTITFPKTNYERPDFHGRYGDVSDDVDAILSQPSVTQEERDRILNTLATYPPGLPPEQEVLPNLTGGGMNVESDTPRFAPEISRLLELYRNDFTTWRPYTVRQPAEDAYGSYTLPGLEDYFVSRYVLQPDGYGSLIRKFGVPTPVGHHFSPETLYHVRGGTARVADASSHDPVLHIAELQSDPGSEMRRRTPRVASPRTLRRGEILPAIDHIVLEAYKPEYWGAMRLFGLPYDARTRDPDGMSKEFASAVVEFAFKPNEFKRALKESGHPDPARVREQRDRFMELLKEFDPGYERLLPWYEVEVAHHQPLPYPLVGDTAEWTRHALRNQLAYALENDFAGMSTASADTVIPYVGGKPEGQIAYYDNMVPSLLERIARSYDPQARVVETLVRTPDSQPWWTKPPNPPADKRRAYYLRFTPELRRAVAERGIPYFSLLPFLLGEPVDDTTVQ